MWDNINKTVEEEMDKPEPDETNKEVKESDFKPKLENESGRIVIGAALDEIAEELEKGRDSVRQLANLMKSSEIAETLSKTLDMKMVARSLVQDNVCGSEKVMAGGWINICMSKIAAQSETTKFRSVNSLLKMILFKLVPYDMCFPMPTRIEDSEKQSAPTSNPPLQVESATTSEAKFQKYKTELADEPTGGKRSKLSVGQYVVKSSKNPDGSRYWMCPYRCSRWFGSSRKCGAHLNEHLDRIYECERCKFQTYSLDSYDHHKCFSGPKTHGPERRRPTKYKRKSSGDEPGRSPEKLKGGEKSGSGAEKWERESGDKPGRSGEKRKHGEKSGSGAEKRERESGDKPGRSGQKRKHGEKSGSGAEKPERESGESAEERRSHERGNRKASAALGRREEPDNDIIVIE